MLRVGDNLEFAEICLILPRKTQRKCIKYSIDPGNNRASGCSSFVANRNNNAPGVKYSIDPGDNRVSDTGSSYVPGNNRVSSFEFFVAPSKNKIIFDIRPFMQRKLLFDCFMHELDFSLLQARLAQCRPPSWENAVQIPLILTN